MGITPFLARAELLNHTNQQEIVLIWAVTTWTETFTADRLAVIAARHTGLTVHIVASTEEGQLTAQRLTRLTPLLVRESELFYCGSTSLRDAIVSGLKALWQSHRRVH
ncbi:hypothetical protein [Chitinimonas sp. BJB300]|uniref:hypothetical protein n=1 Tax=Chitinimonas sp. BJB300 TaxID=1559339 RepID=UPI0035B51466